MANPQLTAYIQENLSKFSKEAVIQSLSSAGWSAIDISAAFMELEHPAPVAPVPPVVPAQKQDFPQRGEFSAVNSPTSGTVVPTYVSDKPVSAPASAPAVAIPPASAIAIVIPTVSTPAKPLTQTQANPNDAFLAEMTKRRKEAEALNPQPISSGDVTISVGSTASPVTQGGLVGMVLKTGLVKTEQQANMVLIGIIIVCLGGTALLVL